MNWSLPVITKPLAVNYELARDCMIVTIKKTSVHVTVLCAGANYVAQVNSFMCHDWF